MGLYNASEGNTEELDFEGSQNPLKLPKDLVNKILLYLDIADVKSVCFTCRGFYYFFSNSNDDFWEDFTRKDHDPQKYDKPKNKRWKEIYVSLYEDFPVTKLINRGKKIETRVIKAKQIGLQINWEHNYSHRDGFVVSDCAADEDVFVITFSCCYMIPYIIFNKRTGENACEPFVDYSCTSCGLTNNKIIICKSYLEKNEHNLHHGYFIVFDKKKILQKKEDYGYSFGMISKDCKKGHEKNVTVRILVHKEKLYSIDDTGIFFTWDLSTFQVISKIKTRAIYSSGMFFGRNPNMYLYGSFGIDVINTPDKKDSMIREIIKNKESFEYDCLPYEDAMVYNNRYIFFGKRGIPSTIRIIDTEKKKVTNKGFLFSKGFSAFTITQGYMFLATDNNLEVYEINKMFLKGKFEKCLKLTIDLELDDKYERKKIEKILIVAGSIIMILRGTVYISFGLELLSKKGKKSKK